MLKLTNGIGLTFKIHPSEVKDFADNPESALIQCAMRGEVTTRKTHISDRGDKVTYTYKLWR